MFYDSLIELLKEEEYAQLTKDVLILRDVFDNSEGVYIDFCHLSPSGNKVIAKKIINYF